ncbi:MAG: hypothetical protein LBS99_02650 [Clostridiales bacterium]|nr:hypothetical protein [Clostridiales bacterium]
MKNNKPEYIICPRCELNYIPNERKRKCCDVCLAELNLVDPIILIPDEDAELEVLCPQCKINFMSPEEEVCFLCAKERMAREAEDNIDDWNYIDEEPAIVEEDPIEISLSELAEQEAEEDDFAEEPADPEDEFEELDEDDIEFNDDEDYEDEDDED